MDLTQNQFGYINKRIKPRFGILTKIGLVFSISLILLSFTHHPNEKISSIMIDGDGCGIINGYTTICTGNTTSLTAEGGINYSWSTGASSPNITVGAGTYTVTVTGAGCNTTVSVVVTEDPTCTTSVYQLCKTINNATVGPDRNAYAHNISGQVSEGYLLNFSNSNLPTSCNLILTDVDIGLELFSYTNNTAPNCSLFSFFGNIYANCGINNICSVAQDILTPGCNAFGSGTTTPGLYTMDPMDCNPSFANPNTTIGVDLVPAISFLGSCPSNETAITDNLLSASFTICVEFKYSNVENAGFIR